MSHLPDNAALRVNYYIGAVRLQSLRGQPKPGLAGAGAADNTGVQVPGVRGIFRARVHSQKFRPGQNDVILKNRIYERSYVFLRPP